MSAVAKWFVFGRPAAADCHVVALFVLMTVRRDQIDTTAQPDWPATVFHWIFNYRDGSG
jgi:hypothetical protein